MKELITKLLLWKTRRIVARYRPTVVAITGSVGKTTTRNAIAAALSGTFHVRTNPANYNNEIGLPLAILGFASPGRSVLGWLRILWEADRLMFGPKGDFPNMLVLEYGADHPGDIARLCMVAQPDVAVLTAISPVHAEHFVSVDALAEEKGTILRMRKPGGLAVVNADDSRVMQQAQDAGGVRVSYGFTEQADVHGLEPSLWTRADASFEPGELFARLDVEIDIEGERTMISLENLLGKPYVSAVMAALAVARQFGIPVTDAAARLQQLKPEPGRLQPIAGIKGSLLLDDSYNAAPASMRAGLETMHVFRLTGDGRRIAVLGSMAELGSTSVAEHRGVGEAVVGAEVDLLVTVGEEARDIARGAEAAGFDREHLFSFARSEEAGRFLDPLVRAGDVIYIKGSQSQRMEKVTKDLLAQPERATELLCRQYGKWLQEND